MSLMTSRRSELEVDLAGVVIDPALIGIIPRSLAFRHDVLAIERRADELSVAVSDETTSEVLDRVRSLSGMRVRVFRASREAIRERLVSAYGESLHDAGDRTDDVPAVRAVEEVHESALRARASDVHLEPAPSGGRMRQRIDGILRSVREYDCDLYARMISRIKVLAGMDVADRRQPQDGRYSIDVRGRSLDIRVSSIPTLHGERLVLRFLDLHARVPGLAALGMPETVFRSFRDAVRAPHGFIVVCGPTGSGKTTTLYAAMSERNVDAQNLCSVEDPVEVRIPGVSQVQVNVRAGLTFSGALRAFLRQDPNVVMVGEMRDEETARIAASAALAGQLVLTTVHANDAPRCVARLRELGVDAATIAATLSAVVAQRLVRRLCLDCREPIIVREGPALLGLEEGSRIFRAAGCPACDGTGYRDRTGIFEMMVLDGTLRDAIAHDAGTVEVRERAALVGFRPMIHHGVERVLAGETTVEELLRVVALESIA